MAKRPVFIPDKNRIGVDIKQIHFIWYAVFSLSQKQKSIAALHKAASAHGLTQLLEISTKSPKILGINYSGFNLSYRRDNMNLPVECGFEGSELSEKGGPYTDIYDKSPIEAKGDTRLENSGALRGYRFIGEDFPLNPPAAFYNWLYIKAAHQNPAPSQRLLQFNSFTDLEINIKKRAACQVFW